MTTTSKRDQPVYRTVAEQLALQCANHDEWLVAVRFFLPSLLNDQQCLFECVMVEAKRQAKKAGKSARALEDYVADTLDDLKLRLVPTGPLS